MHILAAAANESRNWPDTVGLIAFLILMGWIAWLTYRD